MQRVIVALRKKNGEFNIPKFSTCLVEYFSKDVTSVTVNCSHENGYFVLNESDEGFELRHSPQCPIKLLSQSDTSGWDLNTNNKINVQSSTIGLATSVVVESSDSHILLTKRTPHLRSSPNVWVVPGGHLESSETSFKAGVREVMEETGIDISLSKTTIIGLWENVYPLLLGAGMPKYHVLVVYLHAQLDETHEQLIKKIVPNPQEVDSYTWLDLSTVSKLFSKNLNYNMEGKQYVCSGNKITEKNLDYSSMFNKWLMNQNEPYSGVNYALRCWLKKNCDENLSCKF